MKKIVATDEDPRALACARETSSGLAMPRRSRSCRPTCSRRARAPLVICNPPWVPARQASPIEHAIYDPGSRMLLGFLKGLADHLTPDGEGWLILSDFAEHLGLRTRETLLAAIEGAGLRVIAREDIKPKHPKSSDPTDPLHSARVAEITSLWRLKAV